MGNAEAMKMKTLKIEEGEGKKERSRFPSLPSWLSPFFIESAECTHICLRECAESNESEVPFIHQPWREMRAQASDLG